jgi:dipeptidyl aminopeptidase/acylaminoacyl peptidase
VTDPETAESAPRDTAHDTNPANLPRRAVVLGVLLLGLGFVVGYGFHTVQSEQRLVAPNGAGPNGESPNVAGSTATKGTPPVVKGLRVSPDGKRVAFTAVSNKLSRANRFIFDLQTRQFKATSTPAGWQDYIVQWSPDGRKILFDREKIPRGVAETTSGLHEADVEEIAPPEATPTSGATPTSNATSASEVTAASDATQDRPLTPRGVLPSNDRSIAGFWTPDGKLIVKTRREPKFLYELRDDVPVPVDRAGVTYYQNRAVRENGKTVFYVVRDVPNQPENVALFRIENGRSRQLGAAFETPEWVYVAENGRWMIVCREAPDGENWEWTLGRVSPQGASVVSTRVVPGDVSGVFWSPDRKYILGASGESLWLIDIPSLQSRRLGNRTDWDADDAGWLPDSKSVVVAAKGKLWQVDVTSGAAREIWTFPPEYWS